MKSGKNTSFEFSALPKSIREKVVKKRKGKFPVPLELEEAAHLHELFFRKSKAKVVKIIESPKPDIETHLCGCC